MALDQTVTDKRGEEGRFESRARSKAGLANGQVSVSRRQVIKQLGRVGAFGIAGLSGSSGAVETVKGGTGEPDVTTYRFVSAEKQRPIILPEDCGETNEFSKTARGATWPEGATIKYDLINVPEEHIPAIEASFATWEEPSGLTFEQEEGAQSYVKWVPGTELGEFVLAWARVWHYPTEIVWFEIEFNEDADWGEGSHSDCTFDPDAEFDVQGTATHEIGHAIGLGHATAPESTEHAMYWLGLKGSTVSRSLAAGDRRGVEALY